MKSKKTPKDTLATVGTKKKPGGREMARGKKKKKKSNLNSNKEFAWMLRKEALKGTKYLYLCTGCQNGPQFCRPIDRGNTIPDHELWETCDSVRRNSLLLHEF